MQFIDTEKVNPQIKELLKHLNETIIGQPEAKQALIDIIEKYRSGFNDKSRPIGSLLFLGPTGTGKTHLVESACEHLFGSEYACIKIDCGEFQHSSDIAKLIGSPPGYIGHTETPARLKQETLDKYHNRNNKFTFLLFDEIEKASDALWHMMLSILDKGTLTLGNNTTSDFTKCIVVMTSNAGSQEINSAIMDGFGFKSKEQKPYEELSRIAIEAAKRKFTPEFVNRIDRIVSFHTLTPEDNLKIVGIELARLQQRILKYSQPFFYIDITLKAKNQLANQSFNPKENGRNIKRIIEKLIELPLARGLSTNQIPAGRLIKIDYSKDFGFTFEIQKAPGD